MKIVCFGDSITESGVGGWTDWLQQQLGEAHVVVNSGIGANTTMHALDRFDSDVAVHNPDIVVIEFGINDAYVYVHQGISRQSVGEYERNLREIIRLTRRHGAQPVLVINHLPVTNGTVHEQGNGQPIEKNMEPYNATVSALADEVGIPTVDFPASVTEEERAAMLEADGIHLSEGGQEQYGRIILKGLLPVIEQLRSGVDTTPSLATSAVN